MIKPLPFVSAVDYLSSLLTNKIDKNYFSVIFLFQLEAFTLGISKQELLKSSALGHKYILKLLNYPNEINVIVRVKHKIGIIFVDESGFLELSEQTLHSTYGNYWYLTN